MDQLNNSLSTKTIKIIARPILKSLPNIKSTRKMCNHVPISASKKCQGKKKKLLSNNFLIFYYTTKNNLSTLNSELSCAPNFFSLFFLKKEESFRRIEGNE